MYWIAYERTVSTKVQWTDSLGVATRLFQSRTFDSAGDARCHMCQSERKISTDIELYYKDHGGQSGRPDPRMPIERRLMADCYYSIAVRRTDRRVQL